MICKSNACFDAAQENPEKSNVRIFSLLFLLKFWHRPFECLTPLAIRGTEMCLQYGMLHFNPSAPYCRDGRGGFSGPLSRLKTCIDCQSVSRHNGGKIEAPPHPPEPLQSDSAVMYWGGFNWASMTLRVASLSDRNFTVTSILPQMLDFLLLFCPKFSTFASILP